ncbi:hypothetical protein RJT34_02837 [Clitoria ternatea]|uniref:Bromo domain-containing protein n=1 Tax=Clitoria ternatea TaxID=43366 RepID=A0AAN9Q1Y9_CLITE
MELKGSRNYSNINATRMVAGLDVMHGGDDKDREGLDTDFGVCRHMAAMISMKFRGMPLARNISFIPSQRPSDLVLLLGSPIFLFFVALANILEGIVDAIVKDRCDISYLFVKPVSKKEAPDYLDIIESPMDLSKIREKVRNMEYKSREEFRHDVWQITFNAHTYNDGRNPGIPPLADMLLEYCDYLLNENDDSLTEAEGDIEHADV